MIKNLFLIFLILFCNTLVGCNSTDYKEAETLFNNKKYENAYIIYKNLGDYEDSANKAEIAKDKFLSPIYEKALKYYKNGQHTLAYPLFMLLSKENYRDAKSLITPLPLEGIWQSDNKSDSTYLFQGNSLYYVGNAEINNFKFSPKYKIGTIKGYDCSEDSTIANKITVLVTSTNGDDRNIVLNLNSNDSFTIKDGEGDGWEGIYQRTIKTNLQWYITNYDSDSDNNTTGSSSSPSFSSSSGKSDSEIWVWTKHIVENSIKSPSSADFPMFGSTDIQISRDTNGNINYVSSYVDAENSYGASIRTQFEVIFYGGNLDDYKVVIE